jgi:hypothetical protein
MKPKATRHAKPKANGEAKGKALEPINKSRTITLQRKPGKTDEESLAALAVVGLASNSATIADWSEHVLGDVDLTACFSAVTDSAARVNAGDLGEAEALLIAQACSLNVIFIDLARRARGSQFLDQFEKYLRLALKAQSQSRATCESLAVLKNPPVFARQANIANGPQQVNNAHGSQLVNNQPIGCRACANSEDAPIKVLEGQSERVDVEATSDAGARHLALAPVGTVDRAAHG